MKRRRAGSRGIDGERSGGRKLSERGVQVVGKMDLQDAAGGVLDGQLDTGFAAEDGRVDEGAGDAQRVRRRQGGQVEKDEQEDDERPTRA